jgi:quercetin dioxygenase-like cupin family protein
MMEMLFRPPLILLAISKEERNQMRKLFHVLCLMLLLCTPAAAGETTSVAVNVLTKTGSSWDGRDLPGYAAGRPEITILRIQIPPGAQLPRHSHPVINAGVLLKGELTVVTDGGRTLHLKAGDPIVEVVDTSHYGKNEGTEPAEIIVFYAGVKGTPITRYGPDAATNSSTNNIPEKKP